MTDTFRRYIALLLSICLLAAIPAFATEDEEVIPPVTDTELETPPVPDTPEPPADTQEPELSHAPISYGRWGQEITFTATASDNVAVSQVRLQYRPLGQETWTELLMTAGEGNAYSAVLPGEQVTGDILEYYIEASDGTNVALSGTPDLPYNIFLDRNIYINAVEPQQIPVGQIKDGISTTVTGEGFTEGMTVTVGNVPVEYTLVSETQIRFLFPELGLGKADLQITRQEDHGTLHKAFSCIDPEGFAEVDVPKKVFMGQTVRFPITVGASCPVTQVTVQLQADPTLYKNIEFIMGSANAGTVASIETNAEGITTIRLNSSSPIVTSEPIGYWQATVQQVEKPTNSFIDVLQASFHGVEVKGLDRQVEISNNIVVSVIGIQENPFALEGKLPDTTGWQLEIDYEGEKEVQPLTPDMLSLSDTEAGKGYATYMGKTAEFTFEVLQKDQIRSIAVTSLPSRLEFVLGETFDRTGMQVELTYSEGENQRILVLTDYEILGYDPNIQGIQEIQVQYGDVVSEIFTITVLLRGDVNGDGKINITDMIQVKAHILGNTTLEDNALLGADVNGDGKINIIDFVQIKAIILGITEDTQ